MREFHINQNDSGQRIDKFLQKAVKALPPGLLYKAFRTKRIKRNGKRCEGSDRLEEGDVLSLYLNDEVFGEAEPGLDFLTAPSNVSMVYEDENILLADKKPGLVVHEDEENTPDTLIRRIQHYLYEKGEYRPQEEASFAPALCNRLDRNTGGIVIAAKNAESLRVLNQKIRDRELEKRYLCVTVGAPPKSSGTARAYLFKDEKKKQVFLSAHNRPGSKTAVTKYRVLEQRGRLSLVEVELVTGRTHQIRAHMAYLGCPILGDGKYGNGMVNREYGVSGQCLYAYRLAFQFSQEKDSGILAYLDGKSFEAPGVWFWERFFPSGRPSPQMP